MLDFDLYISHCHVLVHRHSLFEVLVFIIVTFVVEIGWYLLLRQYSLMSGDATKPESKGDENKDMSSLYQDQRAQPCHLSSSIFYGGQDDYSQFQSSKGSSINDRVRNSFHDLVPSVSSWWKLTHLYLELWQNFPFLGCNENSNIILEFNLTVGFFYTVSALERWGRWWFRVCIKRKLVARFVLLILISFKVVMLQNCTDANMFTFAGSLYY